MVDRVDSKRNSRIPGFYKLGREERLAVLVERGFMAQAQADSLAETGGSLPFEVADKMIENVVGCFELPIGLGLNFQINGKDYVVPMVVEEPSIVAAVSHAARIVRDAGGFDADTDRSVMTGQIQVVGAADPVEATRRIFEARDRLVARANELEPRMAKRGGGALDLDARIVGEPGSYTQMIVVHLYVDVCDAMGANLINTLCEALAPEIEEITGGRVFLRILSNLTDRRRARARCRIPFHLLQWQGFDGQELCGEIDIPMAIGIVGGPIRLHPTAALLLEMLGVESAAELAQVFGAVGLAQNLSAIKALGSTGIQHGHMALHARSVAATAGATGQDVERVAQLLVLEGNIRVSRAREILAQG